MDQTYPQGQYWGEEIIGEETAQINATLACNMQYTEGPRDQAPFQTIRVPAPVFPAQPTVTLVPHLQIIHQFFAQALKANRRSVIWPESVFPDDIILCPVRLQPWIEFPRLQDDVWTKIMSVPTYLDAQIFHSEVYLQYVALAMNSSPVLSDTTLKIFQTRTVDEFLKSIIVSMRGNKTLRHMFKLRGEVVFDRPRADCVAVATMGYEEPIYAVCYIPPYCLTLPELVAGLRATETHGVFGKEPTTYEQHATAMVVHAIIRLFSRMISSGTQYGYICTGAAYVFLHISSNEPGVVEYYLCVPSQDVPARGYADLTWVRRTALGQVLAFTLQSLVVNRPSHELHDTAFNSLQLRHDDFSGLVPQTSDGIRVRPPKQFLYEKSCWGRLWGNLVQRDIPADIGDLELSGSENVEVNERPYCTMACLRGTSEKELLDKECPNAGDHGTDRHELNSQEIIDRLNDQLLTSRYEGFRQLHVIGRTCYLIKATLLSHGYTVLIKATTARQSRRITGELRNYQDLITLQGSKIPVCLGMFEPKIPYWYHGSQMRYMLVLSWSGVRTDSVTSPAVRQFIESQLEELQSILQEHGVIQEDPAFRNVLWCPATHSVMMIDLEDMKWMQGTVQGSNPRDGPGMDATRANLRTTRTAPEASFEEIASNPRLWHS